MTATVRAGKSHRLAFPAESPILHSINPLFPLWDFLAMQTQKPFFDDLARLAGGAVNALSGLKSEVEALVRQQFERLTATMDVVSREEFEAVRAMAAKAREEQLILAEKLAAIEARLDQSK